MATLSEEQIAALRRYYAEPQVMQQAKVHLDAEEILELEDWIQMYCLYPLQQHDQLADYLRNAEGQPLFPDNLNPLTNQEGWRDAIEIGWQVVEEQLGLTEDDRHHRAKALEDGDWDAFMKSIEARKKARGLA